MTLRGHVERVNSLTLLSDGRLVSSSNDRSIAVWNIHEKLCDFTLEGHNGAVTAVFKLKDGRLVSCSDDKTVKIWQVSANTEEKSDTSQTRCLYTLKGHTDIVTSIAELPDGRVVSASSDRTLRIWNLLSKKCDRAWKAHMQGITSIICLHVPPVTFDTVATTKTVADSQSAGRDARCCDTGQGGCAVM